MKNDTFDRIQSHATFLSSPVPYVGQAAGEESSSEGPDHFISQLAECSEITDFKESISFIVRKLGFTDYSFAVLGAPPAKSLTTLPDKVRDFYLKDDFVKFDVILEHAKGANTPLYLSSLEQYVASAPFASEQYYRNVDYYRLLASLDYHDCYCIPNSFGGKGRRAIFLLFAKESTRDEFHRKVEQCQKLLSMIVGAIVYFASVKFPEHFLDSKYDGLLGITPKPLEMLEAVAKEGLQLKDAAAKLNISLDTANKHVAAAKKSLGATTLSNAVYLAMVHGLITKDENKSEKL